jgi:acetylornithine deacetylase/succinyl-diaminopimelate desuccinylase-like protein
MSTEIESIEQDLKTYVEIPSPSGEEDPLAHVIFEQLAGFNPDILDRVGNGVGAIFDGESRDGSLLVIACHIDTVRFGDIDYTLRTYNIDFPEYTNTWIVGPGAGDDEAGAALMTNIGRRSANLTTKSKKGLPVRTALLYIGQEEDNDDDVPHFVNWLAGEYEPGKIGGIVLEPAYDYHNKGTLYTGQLGGVTVPIEMYGIKGHPALNSMTGTALSKLANYVGSLDEVQASWQTHYSDWTGTPIINALEMIASKRGFVADKAHGIIRIASTEKLANTWDIAKQDLERDGIVIGEFNPKDLQPNI